MNEFDAKKACLCTEEVFIKRFENFITQTKYIKDIESIKNYDKNNLYTSHGLNHIFNVIEYLKKFIGKKKFIVSEDTLFLLSIAALYHDFGMQQGRVDHAKNSAHLFKTNYSSNSLFSVKEVGLIQKIIISHSLDKNEDEINAIINDTDFVKDIKIGVCLLRLADILDCSKSRLYYDNLEGIPFPSYLHWRKHILIDNIRFNEDDNIIYIEPDTDNIKSAWDIFLIEKEFSYIKEEFEYCKQIIGKNFIDNSYKEIKLSSDFFVCKEKIVNQQKKPEFKPYIRFEENEYINLLGRDEVTFDIIWSIFSNNNATVIYGLKGVGKSSLIKCKVLNSLNGFESDKIKVIYIENYDDVNKIKYKLSNNDSEKKIFIFDQFEKILIDKEKLELIKKIITTKDNYRFVFCVLPNQLDRMIKVLSEVDNLSYKLIYLNEISIENASNYVYKVLNIREAQKTERIKIFKIIEFLKATSNENISFNNRLNIVFSFYKNSEILKTESNFEKLLLNEHNYFDKLVEKYHNSLFNKLAEEQKIFLNKFITRNNSIKTIEKTKSTNINLTKILKPVNLKYEFVHSQLLQVYRQNYCEDQELKDFISLEEEFENLYIYKKSASNDTIDKLFKLSNPLFSENENDNNLRSFVIKLLIKEKRFNKKIKDDYKVDSEQFIKFSWELLSEINHTNKQTNFKETFHKYKNLFRINYPDFKIYETKIETYQDIINTIFCINLDDISIQHKIEPNDDLIYISNEVKSEIIELIILNAIYQQVYSNHKNEIFDLRQHINSKNNNLILITNKIPNLRKYIIFYFHKLYVKDAKTETGVLKLTNNNFMINNSELPKKIEKELLYCCFLDKSVNVYFNKNDEIIGITSTDKKIRFFTKDILLKLLLDIKLKFPCNQSKIMPFKENVFNTENSNSIQKLIDDIYDIESLDDKKWIEIKLYKNPIIDRLYELTRDGKEVFYYHKSYDISESIYAKAHKINNNSIIANGNNSPIAIITIGQSDIYFEKIYKNISSFYIYFDDRIALVSKAIDAWCYEIIKLKALIEENQFITKIFLIIPDDSIQEKAIRFLLANNKELIVNSDDFKELNLFEKNNNWLNIFNNIEFIKTNKNEFDSKLYEYFSFNNPGSQASVYIQEAKINYINQTDSYDFLKDESIKDEYRIKSNNFVDAYLQTIKRICTYGYSSDESPTMEMIGMTIVIDNPIEALERFKNDNKFYRKIEIDDYYDKQWKIEGGKIYEYIHSVFGVDQIDIVVSLIANSIINQKVTRKGAMSFYLPDVTKLDKIDSLFSCFISMEMKSENEYSLNPYFVWRSNECVFGLLLSLVNSVRWFNESILKNLTDKFKDVNITIDKYYYHGINMHIENNDLMKVMIKKLIDKLDDKKQN